MQFMKDKLVLPIKRTCRKLISQCKKGCSPEKKKNIQDKRVFISDNAVGIEVWLSQKKRALLWLCSIYTACVPHILLRYGSVNM